MTLVFFETNDSYHPGSCTISGNLEIIASLGIPVSFTPNSCESITAFAAALALA